MTSCRRAKLNRATSATHVGAGHLEALVRAVTMLELIGLLAATLARLFRKRRDLVVENLLLRQQLQVTLRSGARPGLETRSRRLLLCAVIQRYTW